MNKYLKEVTTLQFDSAKCTGCKMCMEVCPHDVFSFADGRAVVSNRDACMECGACALNCRFNALQVRAGVGCAAGIIFGKLAGADGPVCGSDDGNTSCCG